MATAIGLGVQFTANANGMTKGLSQVDRQLQNLGRQAAGAASLFDGFAKSSAAAAQAQQQVATDLAFLNSAFKTGQVSAEQYAAELKTIVADANASAAAFAEGARVTQQVATAEEQRAATLARLSDLLQQGAISQETYNRAAAAASGEQARLQQEEAARAQLLQEGKRVAEQYATAEEKRAAELQRLAGLLDAGAISQETYNRAVANANGSDAAATAAAATAERERAKAIADGAAVTASVQTEQEKRTAELQRLSGLLEAGAISEETYSRAVAVASGAQSAAAEAERQRQAALAEGQAIAARYATDEERRASTLARLGDLLQQGAISQQTYDRAAADASGANEAAAKAEEDRARALARAAQITQANLSPQQKYDQEVQELNQHLAAGRISQETYNAALAKAQQGYDKAAAAAAKYDKAADAAGKGNNLAFNELSGILAAIPGPIGNVAGRLSGLASAGEGLSRVFAGGLSQGFGSLASSAAALVNPLTAAVAGVAAFGASAAAVARGLVELEDRVERLGNLADQLGISFEFVQMLEEAAQRSGVSVDSLTGAMTRLQKTLAGADEESKTARAALSRLGVSIEDLNKLSQEDQIRLIGDRIAAIRDPAQRTAAAVALFGKSGAQLLPFFKNLGPAASDIERLGGALSAIDRKRIDEFGSALDALGVASSRTGDLLILPFTELGTGIAKGATEVLAAVNQIVKALGDVLRPAAIIAGAQFQAFGIIVREFASVAAKQLEPVAAAVRLISEYLAPATDLAIDYARGVSDASAAVGRLGESAATLAGTRFADEIGAAATAAAEFGQAGFEAALAYQKGLEDIAQLQAEGTYTAEEAARAAENERRILDQKLSVLDREADARKRAADEAQRAADADRRTADAAIDRVRVDNEFGGDSQRAQAADNVLAIEREIVRAEEELAAARAAGDQAAADAAAARLAQLDQAAAKERDIASGAAKAREEAEKAAQRAADQRARAEEQRAKEIADLRERFAERLADIERDRLDALSRTSQEALRGNDIRTSEGASQFLALATGREDPAVEEYRKQLRELQNIRREIAAAQNRPVEIMG